MQPLVGLTTQQLETVAVECGERAYRGKQIAAWIYRRGAQTISDMTDLPRELRSKLESAYTVGLPEIAHQDQSADETVKYLLTLHDGQTVESVLLPYPDRVSVCLSTQVGCAAGCTFCATAQGGFARNLTAGEIVGQVLAARDRLGDWPGGTRPTDGVVPTGERCVTNIVMMGMGEPLYNFEAVRDALLIVSDGDGIGISKRRITLSTSGVVPMIERAGAEIGTMLAISLHAVRDDLRNELVPLNRKYPIRELLEACRNYPGASNAKRITFEYVMLKDVNDSIEDAKALVRLLKGIHAKINLIPFNPWPGSRYECSDWEQIEKFSQVVFDAGYASPVRTPRGRDILAACGQLKSESEKVRASARRKAERAGNAGG